MLRLPMLTMKRDRCSGSLCCAHNAHVPFCCAIGLVIPIGEVPPHHDNNSASRARMDGTRHDLFHRSMRLPVLSRPTSAAAALICDPCAGACSCSIPCDLASRCGFMSCTRILGWMRGGGSIAPWDSTRGTRPRACARAGPTPAACPRSARPPSAHPPAACRSRPPA